MIASGPCSRAVRLGAALAALSVLIAAPSGRLRAQTGSDAGDREQALLLRQASILESRGEFQAAEQRLRDVLDTFPGTAAAVFGLDRVLRRQERRAELLPVIDRYLEARPDGRAVRHLELRALAALDSLEAMEAAAREWTDREEGSLEPYAEMLDLFDQAFGPDRALALVQEARRATGSSDALALEAGSILARSGRPAAAGREWSRAIAADGRNLASVLRRVDELPGDRGAVVHALLEKLEEDAESEVRLGAAARLALAAGLDDRAIELAGGVLERLEGRARRGFLVQFAHRAEERRAVPAALWAYRRLRDRPETPDESRALDERIAELALAAGDTAVALEARGRVADSRSAGSVERRRALAARLELEVARLEPGEAADRLSELSSEFPDAPELDPLAAEVARRLLRGGRDEEASAVLAGVDGPRSALERAYLALGAGDVEAGVGELDAAVAGLPPVRATGVLELSTFLEGASPRAAELGGRVAATAHRGRDGEALELLRSGLDGVSLDDRPGLLALGARIAEREGSAGDAAGLRARLLREFPDTPEAPEAAIRLARHRAGDPEGDREAVRILRELILSRPDAAVVPDARRELEKLQERIPGGGG